MRIGLLADTHDRVPAVDELLRRFAAAEVTLVLHTGDYCSPFSLAPFRDFGMPLLGVFGQNDGDRGALATTAAALPAGGELYEAPHALQAAGSSILLVHDLGDANARATAAHQVIVHGCSHRAEMQERGGALLVNPGEACGWVHGTPGGAVLDLRARRVQFITLTEPEWRP